jgi:hypothetical protein
MARLHKRSKTNNLPSSKEKDNRGKNNSAKKKMDSTKKKKNVNTIKRSGKIKATKIAPRKEKRNTRASRRVPHYCDVCRVVKTNIALLFVINILFQSHGMIEIALHLCSRFMGDQIIHSCHELLSQ